MLRHLGLAVVTFAVAGCGGAATQPGGTVHVSVVRLATGDDCVRVLFADSASAARQELREVSLAGRPASTELVFGVVQPDGWSTELDVTATLHLGGCATPAVDEASVLRFALGALPSDTFLTLRQPGAGTDGGVDGGGDAGPPDAGPGDAGVDAGVPDAGPGDAGGLDAGDVDGGPVDAGVTDAGPVDAGPPDAGTPDAGTPDAGMPDAGTPDAGLPDAGACTGAVRVVPAAATRSWTDVALLDSQSVLAVGAMGSIGVFTTAGGFTDWTSTSCGGNYGGVWVRPSDGVRFAVTTAGLRRVDGPGQCTALASLPAGTPRALTGIRVANVTRLYVPTTGPAGVAELDVGQSTVVVRTPPSAGAVYDVAGLDESTLFAVGSTSSGNKGAFWQWNAIADAWSAPTQLSGGNTYIYAVDVVSSVLAFAGGVNGLYRWNGAGWSFLASPGFSVQGVRALSDTEVYVVGAPSGGNVGFAVWNGNGFSTPSRPASVATLARVRGADGCSVWAVGGSGLVVTTAP
jgi:hypothetical protein